MWNKLISWLAKKQIKSAYAKGALEGHLKHKPIELQSKITISTQELNAIPIGFMARSIKKNLEIQFYETLDKNLAYEFYYDPNNPYQFQVKAKISFIPPTTQYPNADEPHFHLIKKFITEFQS